MLVAMMWKYSVQQITAYGIVFLFGISAPLPLGAAVYKNAKFNLFFSSCALLIIYSGVLP